MTKEKGRNTQGVNLRCNILEEEKGLGRVKSTPNSLHENKTVNAIFTQRCIMSDEGLSEFTKRIDINIFTNIMTICSLNYVQEESKWLFK